MGETARMTCGTLASADDLRDLTRGYGYGEHWHIRSDGGATYDVLAYDDSGRVTAGYAWSRRTNLLVRFVQTGFARAGGMTRCRITTARDLGRTDDLIAFDGESFGGTMPGDIARWKEQRA